MIIWFLSFSLLIWCITLIDLHILNNPCISGIKSIWLWCMITFMCCWILFARILLRSFASVFIIDLFFSCKVMSDSLWPHRLQHARLPCPSLSLGVCSNSCSLSQWCHPNVSSCIVHFSSCLQSFPASGSLPMSQIFRSGGQSTGDSALASVLPMNIQGWFPLGLNGFISFLSKELSRVFSKTTVQKHQLFGAQLSLCSNSTSVHDYWKHQSFGFYMDLLLAKWCLFFNTMSRFIIAFFHGADIF